MSTATPAKPAVTPAARRPPATTTTSNGTPSRSPSRLNSTSSAATAGNGTNGSTPAISRTRSVRTGSALSTRAPAAGRKPPTPDNAAELDAKAEMRAKMDELQEKLQQVEAAYEESQKQAANLQLKLDETLKEQSLLDERVHEHAEQINDLENEKKESLRARRELEHIYESEKAALVREQEEWVTEKESMQSSIQRLRETLAQREIRAGLEDERRPSLSRQSSVGRNSAASPGAEERHFAPSSLKRSDSFDSRQNSKFLIQKDKIIESLRLELAEAQIKLVEMENMGGGRMQELQRQMYEVKMQNARLMEENESFQLLLQEKALNGELLQPPSTGSRPPSRSPDADRGATSLADELESHVDNEGSDETRRLQTEVNSMKDQNKALTLYINNIISRLLQHEQFEQILDKTPDLMAGPNAAMRAAVAAEADKDKDLPPPPPEKDDQQPAGFLQRARSVMGGRPKRPTSQLLQPGAVDQSFQQHARSDENVKLHEDPQTAPSVPLKPNRGHRRANSDWPAASVVTNMYRGAPGAISPLSTGLSSPTRTSFFPSQPLGARIPSSSLVSTISETDGTASGPRDSKLSTSSADENTRGRTSIDERSSSASRPLSGTDATSNPSSPPRSTSSTADRDSIISAAVNNKTSGAVMMGSRMRPLRLVQEAAEQDEALKKQAAANNRGSWFGWMNKGAAAAIPNFGPPARASTTDGHAVPFGSPSAAAREQQSSSTSPSPPQYAGHQP